MKWPPHCSKLDQEKGKKYHLGNFTFLKKGKIGTFTTPMTILCPSLHMMAFSLMQHIPCQPTRHVHIHTALHKNWERHAGSTGPNCISSTPSCGVLSPTRDHNGSSCHIQGHRRHRRMALDTQCRELQSRQKAMPMPNNNHCLSSITRPCKGCKGSKQQRNK